jgi:chemotaxis protein CheD
MEQARERTIAARSAPADTPPAPPQALLAAPRTLAALPPSAPRAAPRESARLPPAVGASWQVQAKPGDHLMLLPGQMHFGGQAATLRTLLGSCVAVTLWHPAKRIGGMCHFLLPTRTRRPGDPADGRYGDEAIDAMVELLRRAGTEPHDYHAHLYGGADTMPEGTNLMFNVGERNIEKGWSLIDRWGFQLQGVDVGEDVPRSLTLTLATGGVEMRRGGGKAPPLQLTPGNLLPPLKKA